MTVPPRSRRCRLTIAKEDTSRLLPYTSLSELSPMRTPLVRGQNSRHRAPLPRSKPLPPFKDATREGLATASKSTAGDHAYNSGYSSRRIRLGHCVLFRSRRFGTKPHRAQQDDLIRLCVTAVTHGRLCLPFNGVFPQLLVNHQWRGHRCAQNGLVRILHGIVVRALPFSVVCLRVFPSTPASRDLLLHTSAGTDPGQTVAAATLAASELPFTRALTFTGAQSQRIAHNPLSY